MQCRVMRATAREQRELRESIVRRCLIRRLCATLASAARRLDCLGLEPLLKAIPDSNEDFSPF